MKKLIIILSLLASSAYAAETIGEKVDAKAKDTGRAVKAKVHRAEEKLCDEVTGENCVAKKVRNRGTETKDYVKDKAEEGKNIIDNKKDNHNQK